MINLGVISAIFKKYGKVKLNQKAVKKKKKKRTEIEIDQQKNASTFMGMK